MPSTKTIGGLQRGPDFERDIYEPARVERVVREDKLGRRPEPNDPLIRAAIEAGREVGEALARRVEDEMGRELEELSGEEVEAGAKPGAGSARESEEDPAWALDAGEPRKPGDAIGRQVDVEYDRDSGTIVIKHFSADGEEVVRRVPPEEMIRTAQRLKEQRAQLLENVM